MDIANVFAVVQVCDVGFSILEIIEILESLEILEILEILEVLAILESPEILGILEILLFLEDNFSYFSFRNVFPKFGQLLHYIVNLDC